VDRIHHVHKIGKIRYVRAVSYRSRKDGIVRLAVIVRGEKGYCRFEGFCFGYGGEGPHGLRRLFEAIRVPESIAVHICHETKSPDYSKNQEHWRLDCGTNNEWYRLRVYNSDGITTENQLYEIVAKPQPVQLQLAY